MSQQNKNSPFLSSRPLLFAVFLFLFLASCSVSRTKNYFDPNFRCVSGPGWRDGKDFLKYKLNVWNLFRAHYREENQRIKNAKIVVTGNSLALLFLPQMEKELPKMGVVNRAIGGDMTETLLERLDEDVLSLSPSTIIIEIGGNDMIYTKCLPETQANVEAIVAKIHSKQPSTQIIFIAVPPTRVPELNQIVPVYNLYLKDFAKEKKNVRYVEVWDEMKKQDEPSLKEEYFRESGDPIHFNDKGYEVWGRKLRPLLRK
ncbi:SGNH/GDSL hydrolase family protein [Leptospira idonii]|uniref:Lipase n=1 Tax=Leptospira idonii TaxID=1193500 RepID=A0A4R9M3M2_9LEPT|nr:GDSL-type esterase/lipase family protein [Leptospira idonii]TGN20712.1 lipase [Leptospira idonii]